jgi:hypothetical protein
MQPPPSFPFIWTSLRPATIFSSLFIARSSSYIEWVRFLLGVYRIDGPMDFSIYMIEQVTGFWVKFSQLVVERVGTPDYYFIQLNKEKSALR